MSSLHYAPGKSILFQSGPRAYNSSFIIPDFPHTTRWLTQEERALATKRLQYTSGSHDTERGSLWSGVEMAILDYKVWLLSYVPSLPPKPQLTQLIN